MKTIRTSTATALLIVAGSMIPAFAQESGNGHARGNYRDDRPQQQGNSRGQERFRGDQRGADRRGDGQQFRQRDVQPQFQQRQGNWQQQSYNQQQSYSQQRQSYNQQQYRSQNNYRDAGNSFGPRPAAGLRWADRGGYQGRMIPQNRFNGSFGRQHFFRIGRPVYYGGFPRFSYGGYAFQLLDPAPDYWGPDWYDTNDVYVDYQDDGYYLYNRSYPGAGIALNIDF